MMRSFISLLLLLIMFTCSTTIFSESNSSGGYWPKETWRTSTPEAQGMDSERIYRMLKYIKENPDHNAHSVLVIRNGFLVTEAYFNPYHKDAKQNIYSCTKSFTSALIGIAIQEGFIKSIHQKAVVFFPEYSIDDPFGLKNEITVENLLTMTAGLDWNTYRDGALVRMMLQSNDSIQFMLDRPMTDEPGVRFNYSTGVSQLLSAIIQRASKEPSTLDFAGKLLLEPLGITDSDWEADARGINLGGMSLILTPVDMAKFGYLYLRQGIWNGKPVVPVEWVETSTQEHIRFNSDPSTVQKYGYHWWVEPFGFSAQGWGGQSIFIIPKLDMVVVFTNGKDGVGFNTDLASIVEMYLISAVKSNQPLPPNKKTASQLKNLLREIETPKPKPVPPLPKIATKISGKAIRCVANGYQYQSLSLRFLQKNTCFLTITWDDGSHSDLPVGLDGVYRTTVINPDKSAEQVALKGSWVSDSTFNINWQELRYPERLDYRLVFDGNGVSIEVSGAVVGHYETFRGKME